MSATLDLSPAARPAPAARRILRHARTEAMLLLRNGEQLLLALVIPVGVLVLGRFVGPRLGVDLPTVAPSVLALAVWSTAFCSLAIATGFERRYSVLERLASTPLGRTGLLAGKALSIVSIVAGQCVVLGAVAAALGWRPPFSLSAALCAVLAVALAVVAFAALGLLLAGTLRAEITLALANLVYLVGLVAGGLMVPVATLGSPVGDLLGWLPTGALGEALRAAGHGTAAWWTLLPLAAWAAGLTLVTRKAFRWTS